MPSSQPTPPPIDPAISDLMSAIGNIFEQIPGITIDQSKIVSTFTACNALSMVVPFIADDSIDDKEKAIKASVEQQVKEVWQANKCRRKFRPRGLRFFFSRLLEAGEYQMIVTYNQEDSADDSSCDGVEDNAAQITAIVIITTILVTFLFVIINHLRGERVIFHPERQ